MASELITTSSSAGWKAQNLQLIAFPCEPQTGASNPEWFINTIGVEPETTSKKYRRVDAAIVDGRHVTLTIDLGRIAWAEMAIVDNENLPEEMPTLGDLTDAVKRFSKLIRQWLPHCPPINRLSFAGKILLPTTDRIASYKQIGKYLTNVKIDGETSSDFIYRINRKRKSITLPAYEINRLSTWASLKLTIVAKTELSLEGAPEFSEDFAACSVDLDINTIPEITTPIPSDRLIDLFDELLSLGMEIAEKGDIP